MSTTPGQQDSEEGRIEPFFGAFVLETLTIGLYGEARSAIREYVQNGLDAVLQAVDEELIDPEAARIDIRLEGADLIIHDNGIGLGQEVAVGTLASIGASRKDYRDQAGFRGIGRLAGIAFCDRLVFLTKARGEQVTTRVAFDAKQLREDMSPAKGGRLSLQRLLEKNVKATTHAAMDAVREGFFEVRLEGLVNAPAEATDLDLMVDFVAQVAPVGYSKDFVYREQIEQAARERPFARRASPRRRTSALEEVTIVVHEGERSVEVCKPYGATFTVGRDDVPLNDIIIHDGASQRWWGWVGLKREPGAFKSDATKAIRVRLRNIQIDGTQVMSEMFSSVEDAASYGRFNDWYVGEIFVDPTFVIPNSRRDGFEDNQGWAEFREELIDLCADLGKRAYDISKKAQLSVEALARGAKDLDVRAKTLTAAAKPDTDKLITLSSDVTKLQRKVSRAYKFADLETASQLRSLENRLLDTKTRAVRKLGVSQTLDASLVREQTQKETLRELMRAFRTRLEPRTLSMVSSVVEELYGTTDFA